jgi:hypothetical protein
MIATPSTRAAARFAEAAMQVLATRPEFRAALRGGPPLTGMLVALHALPAFHRIDWRSVQLFAVDAGWDEPSSQALISLPIPRSHLHRPRSADISAVDAARLYEGTLRTQFGLQAGELPVFDWVLLATDCAAHDGAAADAARLVVAQPRVMLSRAVLQAATQVLSPSTVRSTGTATPPTVRPLRSCLSPR